MQEFLKRIVIPLKRSFMLYLLLLIFILPGCTKASTFNSRESGEEMDLPDPSSQISYTPTPKAAPSFVGPRDDEDSGGNSGPSQSLPDEPLSEIPADTEGEGEGQIDSTPVENNIFGYEYGEISQKNGLELMATAGANWVRRAGIWWPDVEPTKGSYDWNKLEGFEAEFLRASENDLQVILIVRGTPDWAQADPPYDRTCGRIREEELTSFGKFLKELVKRYSYPPYNVLHWEIWNEPDVDPALIGPGNEWMGCWGDSSDPYYGGEYFAELLKAVYPEVKMANPDAQVLVGGLLLDCDPINIPENKTDCTPSNFLEGILINGGGPYFDGVSFHAYDPNHSWLGGYFNKNWHSEADTTGPVLLAKVAFLKDVLNRYNLGDKDLYNTEAALLCLYGELAVCEMTKAYYVVHSYVSAYSVGLKANLWYFWQDQYAGLFDTDLNPSPALETYTYARSMLMHTRYIQEITDFMPSVRVYEFTRAEGKMWVLWSMDGERHTVILPSTPSKITDAFGEALTGVGSIAVDLMPLYVEWHD